MTKTQLVRLLAAACVVSLTGCVTPGQRVAQPTARDDPSSGCFAALPYDSRFVPLREKMAINLPPHQPTLEMLADRTFPNAEQKQLLSAWVQARRVCSDSGESFRAQYAPPEYRATINANQTIVAGLVARLYTGEITFGEFNRLRAENSAAAQSRLAAVDQRARDNQAAAAAQDEAQRRQAVGMALQNMQFQQQQQQMIQQQNRPVTTNCQRIFNQVQCTTQ